MKCRIALTALLAICTTAAVNAFADDDGDKDGRPRGPRPGGPPKAEDIFKRMDSNSDGKVTLDEFKKAHERLQARMRQHRPPHFGPPHFRPPHRPPLRAGGDHGHRHHYGHREHGHRAHGHHKHRGHHSDHHRRHHHGDKQKDDGKKADGKKDDKKETSAAVDYRV